MRTLLMMLVGIAIVGTLFLGNIGPIELIVWLALVIAWVVALVKWALPRDRATA